MLYRVPLIGNGNSAAPYSAAYPHFSLVAFDPGRGIALIDIPTLRLPAEVQTLLSSTATPTLDTPGLMVDSTLRQRWRDFLVAMYNSRALSYNVTPR